MQIFFLTCNAKKIQELMLYVNEKLAKCQCMSCYETGRTQEAPFRQADGYTCNFTIFWEEILNTYDIKFQHHRIPDDTDDVQFMKDITNSIAGPRFLLDTEIVNIGYDEHWRNVALGRKLAHGSDPFTDSRNKIRHLLE